MANTASYPIIAPKAGDLLVGTQTYTVEDKVIDNPTRNFTVASVASLANSINLGYTCYAAWFSQTGTSVPVVTELQNTTGKTFTWGYTDVGRYSVVPNTAWVANKVLPTVSGFGTAAASQILDPTSLSNTAFGIKQINSTNGAYANGVSRGFLEIRIYS